MGEHGAKETLQAVFNAQRFGHQACVAKMKTFIRWVYFGKTREVVSKPREVEVVYKAPVEKKIKFPHIDNSWLPKWLR